MNEDTNKHQRNAIANTSQIKKQQFYMKHLFKPLAIKSTPINNDSSLSRWKSCRKDIKGSGIGQRCNRVTTADPNDPVDPDDPNRLQRWYWYLFSLPSLQ